MIGPRLNPFRPTRWEHQPDGFQLIWFTKDADELAAEKSAYVRGSRGSGKTTLLKSICWEDLVGNTSLKLQRTLGDFSHLGIYVRFPDHVSASLSYQGFRQLYPQALQPELEFHRFFSLIVELTCAERLLDACHQLRLGDYLEITSGLERKFAEELTGEFHELADFADTTPRTFYEVGRLLRAIVRQMNEACGRGTVPMLNERLPSREPGEFLQFIAERLSSGIRLKTIRGPRVVTFKFCLDDCEVLSTLQQRSVNTLVRTSRHPISWVVSSVGSLFDSTETFIPQQPLTDADRKVMSLDTRNNEDFRTLCQAVVGLRLLFSVSDAIREELQGRSVEAVFPLEQRLGGRNVNELMAAIAQRSTSATATQVVHGARALRQALRRVAVKYKRRYPPNSQDLPLYEAYVLLHWQGGEEAFRTHFDISDLERLPTLAPEFASDSFEAWLRRKQGAALLHFAARLGFRKLPLGGAHIAVALADRSIRDFLEVVGEIFEAYTRRHKLDRSDPSSLDRFASVRTQIAWDVQSEGIYAASDAYLQGVSNRADLDTATVRRLLDGLGQYTSLLQSDPDDPAVLGRAERGIFTIRFSRPTPSHIGDLTPEKEKAVWSAIQQAEIAGYLRTINSTTRRAAEEEKGGREISVRLHRRFAPSFRFSYRGAYEEVILSPSDLWLLCDPGSPADPKSWAQAMASRLARIRQTLPLLQIGGYD